MPAELTDEQLAAIRADVELAKKPRDEPGAGRSFAAAFRCVEHCRSLLSALSSARESGAAAERERIAARLEGVASRLRSAGGSVADGLAETYEDAARIARGDGGPAMAARDDHMERGR